MTTATHNTTQRTTTSARMRTLATVPQRLTGLYRLSIMAKEPFQVEFGGRPRTDVRSLEIFHEAPMFIDNIAGLRCVRACMEHGRTTGVQLHPGEAQVLSFRITAEEPVPELDAFTELRAIGLVETPVYDRGCAGQVAYWTQEKVGDIADRLAPITRAGAHVARAVASPFVATAAMAPAIAGSLLASGAVVALYAVMAQAAATAAPAAMAVDPSRTYINGKLYKNLAEVRVRIRTGRILGHATP